MGSSGGSQSGDTTYNWNPSMQPRWDNYLNMMERSLYPAGTEGTNQDLSQFKKYTDPRFAGLAANQSAAIANTGFLSQQAQSPITSMTDASKMTQDTLTGKFQDPFAGQDNPFAAYSPTVYRNEYSGPNSDAALAVKNQGMQDIVNAWQQGTNQDVERMGVLSGAYGGSDYQKAKANADMALGKSLGQYGNQFDQNQLDRSANYEQQFLNNTLQNQTNNKNMGGNWWQQSNALGSQADQAERQRQMAAAGLGYGEQGLALDRLNASMQTGALDRQLGDPSQGRLGQNQLDFNYQQTQDQNNWPFKLMQMLTGTYSTAQGNTGQSMSAYSGGSNLGGILGGLLGGYALSQ